MLWNKTGPEGEGLTHKMIKGTNTMRDNEQHNSIFGCHLTRMRVTHLATKSVRLKTAITRTGVQDPKVQLRTSAKMPGNIRRVMK